MTHLPTNQKSHQKAGFEIGIDLFVERSKQIETANLNIFLVFSMNEPFPINVRTVVSMEKNYLSQIPHFLQRSQDGRVV
jgi:hypothetical protein